MICTSCGNVITICILLEHLPAVYCIVSSHTSPGLTVRTGLL